MKKRITELDALRGVAALSVVLFHFTMGRPQAKLGFNLGETGVDLFFMISGFVIFMTISRISTAKEFLVNRISRLFPAYWICVTFTFLLTVLTRKFYFGEPFTLKYLAQYAGNMTMLQYYLKIPNIDGPYWTLTIELIFYGFILLLFQLNLLRRISAIGFIVLFSIGFNQLYLKHHVPGIYKTLENAVPFVNHFPLFFAGILFYKLHTGGIKKAQSFFVYLLIVCCYFDAITLFEKIGRAQFINLNEYAFALSVYFLLFILFVSNRLGFIVNRGTLFLGTISYSLYLVHQFLSVNVILPGLMKIIHLNFWLSALIALLIVLGLASLVTFYVEIPARKFLKGFFTTDQPALVVKPD